MYVVKVASKPTRTVITSLMHLAVVNAIIATEFELKWTDTIKPLLELNRVSTLVNDFFF